MALVIDNSSIKKNVYFLHKQVSVNDVFWFIGGQGLRVRKWASCSCIYTVRRGLFVGTQWILSTGQRFN